MLPCITIPYSVMIQCYSVKINIPQRSLVCKSRKVIVETISKQLEYVTKGHIAMQTILILFQI